MTTHMEIVMLSGHLIGMGRECTCVVGAIKEWLPGTTFVRYMRCMILDVQADLPDGQYQVTFADRTVSFRRDDGAWITLAC